MKYVITTEQYSDAGELIGTLTHTVNETEDEVMTVTDDVVHTFGDVFFDAVVGIVSCEAALTFVGKSCEP